MARSLGTYLRDKRIAEEWTQREIARRANEYLNSDVIDQGRVSYWERGEVKSPAADYLRMLAAVYRVPIMDLLVVAGFVEEWEVAGGAGASPEPDVEAFHTLAELTDKMRREIERLERRRGNGNGEAPPPIQDVGQ